MPTTAVIIQNTPVAIYLAANAIEKKRMTGRGFLDDKLATKIRIAYRFVKHIWDIDPNYGGMYEVCNWMWELCGIFGKQAMVITGIGGGGGVATPSSDPALTTFEYVRRITASDFTGGADYNTSWIAGLEVYVFWNNVNRYLTGQEIRYTPGGFTVFIDDGSGNNSFDAGTNNTDVEMIVYKRFPLSNGIV